MKRLTHHPDPARGANPRSGRTSRQPELIWLAMLLFLLNLPLAFGGNTRALSFQGDAVASGEWWRLLTCALVHVSPYHAALDGAAFLLLYRELPYGSAGHRLACLGTCAAGSLLGAIAWSPLLKEQGLSGLSGVDHGLMAIVALAAVRDDRSDAQTRHISFLTLCCVLGKSLLEQATGHALFASVHLGSVGVPIVACHLGGVVAGICFALLAGVHAGESSHLTSAPSSHALVQE